MGSQEDMVAREGGVRRIAGDSMEHPIELERFCSSCWRIVDQGWEGGDR